MRKSLNNKSSQLSLATLKAKKQKTSNRSFTNRIVDSCSSIFNSLKLVSQAVLDSDDIADELFDSDGTDFTSALKTEKYNTLERKMSLPSTSTTATTAAAMATDNSINNNNNNTDNIDNDTKANEGFVDREKLWQEQHDAWLTPSNSLQDIRRRQKRQELSNFVSEGDYHIVYKNLVMSNKSLKQPMNLSDALKVIESGWEWNKVFERAAKGLP